MFHTTIRPLVWPMAGAVLLLALQAEADTKSLIDRIPSEANTVVALDVQRILASTMGIRERWKEKLADPFAERPPVLRPDAVRVVMAAALDLATAQTRWEVAAVELKQSASMEILAKTEGGYLDNVGGRPAVCSPIGAYFVQLDSLLLGTAAPADRQFAARWASRKHSPSEYLRNAAAALDADAEFVLAVDLQDVTSASKVLNRLRIDPPDCLANAKADAKAIAAVLGSLKGVTLRVDIAESATARGVVDFGADAAVLAPFAGPLVLEALSEAGVYIEDIEGWTFSVRGATITAEGPLSKEGLRRLFSVLSPPSPADSGVAPAPPANAGDAKVAASRAYYRRVVELADPLAVWVKKSNISMNQTAAWLRRDARRIEQLPTANVDPDLVKWGGNVAVQLAEAGRVLNAADLRTQARVAAVQREQADVNTGIDPVKIGTEKRRAMMEERTQAVEAVHRIVADLIASRDAIRAEMAKRYGAGF